MKPQLYSLFLSLVLMIVSCSTGPRIPGIHGTLTDANGKPISGAEVKLTKSSDPKRAINTTQTGTDGVYYLPNPQAGQYILTISWIVSGACKQSGLPMSRNGEFVVALAQRSGGNNVVVGVTDKVNISADSVQTFDLKFEQCTAIQKNPRTQQQNDFLATLSGNIAFTLRNPGSLFIMKPDGSDLRRIAVMVFGPIDCSPDGKHLVLGNDVTGDIYIINLDDSNQIRLTEDTQREGSSDPRWSPDGTRIVYTTHSYGSGRYSEIFLMNADGSQKKQLTENGKINRLPVWSPDGKRIAFYTEDSSQRIQNYYTMDPDGSNISETTEQEWEGFARAWSPDNKAHVAINKTDDYYDVFVVSADGSISVNLTENKESEYTATWCQ